MEYVAELKSALESCILQECGAFSATLEVLQNTDRTRKSPRSMGRKQCQVVPKMDRRGNLRLCAVEPDSAERM